MKTFSQYFLQLGSLPFSSLPLANPHSISFTNSKGTKGVYFGEMEKGSTSDRKGRGIQVFSNKQIHLGHFDNGQLNGLARVVYDSGN